MNKDQTNTPRSKLKRHMVKVKIQRSYYNVYFYLYFKTRSYKSMANRSKVETIYEITSLDVKF